MRRDVLGRMKAYKEELVALSICSSRAELDANHPAIMMMGGRDMILEGAREGGDP